MRPELTGMREVLVMHSSRTSWVKSRLMKSALCGSIDAILGGIFIFVEQFDFGFRADLAFSQDV